ncbi:lipid-binding SYLF domain-containing protein [Allohahella marinimesophila]|uniref:Ysc84 actin-binding domain-containing protein n=1 Tax=Allohahella marinimesophila TaxID=1054972 RepID=A0ABP7PGC4_9GAMM
MNMKLNSIAASVIAVASLGFMPAAVHAAETTKVENAAEKRAESKDTLQEAATVLEAMKKDPDFEQLLQDAKGVFLVPNYARAALGVGAAGGEGVLLTSQNGEWSGPMFYNMGAINAGVEIGIEAGQIAMVLNTDKAVETFMDEHNFSLNADAGLTIVDYSKRGQASWGKGDIVIWSDTEGAFVDAAVTVEDIFWDEEENKAFYGKDVTPQTVADGKVKSMDDNPVIILLGTR